MKEPSPDYACDYPHQRTHTRFGKPRKRHYTVVECSVCHARILDGSLKCWHSTNAVFCDRCVKDI